MTRWVAAVGILTALACGVAYFTRHVYHKHREVEAAKVDMRAAETLAKVREGL